MKEDVGRIKSLRDSEPFGISSLTRRKNIIIVISYKENISKPFLAVCIPISQNYFNDIKGQYDFSSQIEAKELQWYVHKLKDIV
jgi:hypothetical protein